MRSVLPIRLAQVVCRGQIQDLAFVEQPDVNMVIWTRPAQPPVAAFLTAWALASISLAFDVLRSPFLDVQAPAEAVAEVRP